jgi:hypothetical protein
MKKALQFFQPVLGLDRCHLKSRWKGTMYIATVKSPLDEVFPVAITISSDIENYSGWKRFMENLKEAVPLLCQPHY